MHANQRTTFAPAPASADMGLAPGGRMKQEIFEGPFGIDEWDRTAGSRCYVHMANSLVWEAITGEKPPTPRPVPKLGPFEIDHQCHELTDTSYPQKEWK